MDLLCVVVIGDRHQPVTRPPLLPHTRRHAETDDGPRVQWEGAVAATCSRTDLFAFPHLGPDARYCHTPAVTR